MVIKILEKEMAIHSSTIAWKIPWTEKPGRLQSAAAAAKLLQSCPTLCDLRDGSPPGSPSLGFSRQEYWSGLPGPPPGDLPNTGIEGTSLTSLSRVRLFVTPWTVAYQAPLSVGFSRQ